MLEICFRELREETNISHNDVLKIIENFYYFEFSYEVTNEMKPSKEYCFGFKIDLNFEIDITFNVDKEHDTYQWVSYENALNLLKYKDNKDALQKLYFKLKNI